jgi:pilus assembly protein FimV
LAAALFLLGFVLESSALTIGRPQGAVWIGKPLDLVVPLSLDEAESSGALCLEAEVVQGDLRIPDRSLSISLEPGPNPASSRMRIRSSTTVDEPVLNVNVRAGCETRSTRSYVLLADVPTEASLPSVALPRPAAEPPSPAAERPRASSRTTGAGSSSGFEGGVPARRNGAAVSSTGTQDAEAPAARRSAPAARPAAARPPAVAARAAPRAPAAPKAAPAAPKGVPASAPAPVRAASPSGSRLQLDAMEPDPVAQPGLKATPQLTLRAAEDPARRSAAAAEWRALNAEPEAVQREAQRMQALETTLNALREQTAQHQRALLELRTELVQAREERYRNPLVYALVALLLAALIAILLLWRLAARRAESAWWREPASKGDEGPTRPGALGTLLDDEDVEPPARRHSANATSFGAATFAGVEPEEDSGFGESHPPHPTRAPEGHPLRPVNTEELFDVQQQSDFFLSLGQHDQAIAVLREHIATNPGTSALAYLDLLRIYHSLDRKEDYARLADEFERAFNAYVPKFDQFEQTGKGLEHYRSTLSRIESQWPAPGTLALIEELIFRKPGVNDEDEVFDLAAYQELLLLYSVAKEVIDPDSAPPAPVTPHSFVDTFGHGQMATTPAPLEAQRAPEPVEDGPMLPDSIYGAIDDSLEHETVLAPDTPTPARHVARRESARVQPGASLDLADFDKTAFETMRAPIDTPKSPPAPSTDPNVIDFELFDPDTEAEIAPKPIKR